MSDSRPIALFVRCGDIAAATAKRYCVCDGSTSRRAVGSVSETFTVFDLEFHVFATRTIGLHP